MPRLPTAKEVYDRIRWDPRLDGRDFTIGYEERGRGTEEIAYTAFVPDGDIPWHRLRYVRRGAEVVWDRRTKTCSL